MEEDMNDLQTLEFIEECNKLGSKPGLLSITELTRQLGNPQDSLKFIHIAGTNGKGSTLSFLSTTLTKAGYKVGRYLSPVIFEYRERFQINGKMISKKDLNIYMERIKEACEKMTAQGYAHPTSFEIETALSFLYFKEKNCDVVVLETGMGGLLDATNIITTTIISVITSISMDHMQFLGQSLKEIAGQKAGIIKENTDVITVSQDDTVMQVLRQVSKEKKAELIVADKKDISHIHYGIYKQSFTYQKVSYEISLSGMYQIENAYLSLRVLQRIREKHLLGITSSNEKLTDAVIGKGLFETQWKGRFTIIGKKPFFVVDGAHNEAASLQLTKSVDFYFTNKRKIYIMGMFRDKECEKVVQNTVTEADQVITVTTPFNNRALPGYDLARIVKEYNPNVTVADSLEEAVEMSYLFADKDSVIIAFGSLSYLGALMTIVENHKIIRSDTHGK